MLFTVCKKKEINISPHCYITSPSEGATFECGVVLNIYVSANDADGRITEVQFYIDDEIKSTVYNPPYNYNWETGPESIGIHLIKVKVFDDDEAVAYDELSIKLIEVKLADFSATPLKGKIPLTVSFSDLSINNPTSWEWDFGDGNISNEQSPTHTYNEMGAYDVSLTTSNDSETDTEIKPHFIIAKGLYTDTRDNKEYNIIALGEQVWFAENLNFVTNSSWWYNDNESNGELYGRLYTWEEAQIVCPAGYHLPTDDEWKTLEMFLGMSLAEVENTYLRGTDEGKKIKSMSGWVSDVNGTDEFGFNAQPAGERWNTGTFLYMGSLTAWWVVEDCNDTWANIRYVESGSDKIGRRCYTKNVGYSIRCLKD